jgi:hypothetical protein
MSDLRRRLERLEGAVEQHARLVAPDHARSPPFERWLPHVAPGYCWTWPHLVHIRERLDRVAAGTLRRLVIQTAPRHGKSELATIHFPAWTLERSPGKRVIVGSYNATLAERFSRRVRRICESRMVLSDERRAASDWETAAAVGCARSAWAAARPAKAATSS